MRFLLFAIDSVDTRLQPFGPPCQRATRLDDIEGRYGAPHYFRKHGGKDEMILGAEDDYFHLRWQQAFETLRQGNSGEAASDYHESLGTFGHYDLGVICPAFSFPR
jgi:hypothetical protein